MLFLLLVVLLIFFIYKSIRNSKYWEDRNVVQEPALPIVGNMGSAFLMKKHAMDIIMDLYTKYSDYRYVGLMQFTRPMLMVRDIELIKEVTIKHFDHFHDHFTFARNNNDPIMSKTLITLTGQDWQQMRATLSPVFTSSKMRTMYQLISDYTKSFIGHFQVKEPVAVDAKDIFSRFAADVIATTAFGVKTDSLNDPKNSFFKMGTRLNVGLFQFAKLIIVSKFPFLADFVGAQIFPTEVTNFFTKTVKDNISKRQKDGIVRPDLIHLLLEARKGKLKQDVDKHENEEFATVEESEFGQSGQALELTDEDIVAQAMLFFTAGFETASTASCFLAHELAVSPDVQKKLQDEIDSVNKQFDGNIPYESLLSMKYLDQVVSEGLRLWPPAFQTDRVCTKEFTISPKGPNECQIVMEKGDSILVPIMAIHRDSQYYPNPDKFDPERFSEENKANIFPGTYLPFGVGPRNCIGSRFALLEIKTLFFHLLAKFDIIPVRGTQIPIRISPKNFNLTPVNGFRLGFKPRKVASL